MASDHLEEVLGDAVLELVISDELFRGCRDFTEGELSKARSSLVCEEALSQAARSCRLGDFLLLGKGEEASGGRLRGSILSAVFESVVAAVYLDRGYESARRFILKTIAPQLDEYYGGALPQENPKSRLQEFVQGQGLSTPSYRLVSSAGPDHQPVFTVEVLVEGEVMGTGHGGSKAGAERTAATQALASLTSEPVSGRAE